MGPLLSQNLLQSRQLRASYAQEQRAAEESSLTQVSVPEIDEAIAVEETSVVEEFWLEAIVERIKFHPGRIVEVVFKSADSNKPLPDFSAGAHTEVKLPSGKVRAYTISNAPPDGGRYRLAVKVEEEGKGGSLEIETLTQGQQLMVKRPGNNFLLKEDRQHYFLVAGGIGITPMVAFANRLKELGKTFEVHYSVKAREQAIYASELESLASGRLYIHENRQWLSELFDRPPEESAVYVCGPRGLIDAVTKRAIAGGIPKRFVFREDFGSSNPDKPFQLVLASTGQAISIEPGQTIARVLNDRGTFVPVSCGYGICGVCTAHLLDGEPDARDSVYSDEEKKNKITLCCSRSLSEKLVIDL